MTDDKRLRELENTAVQAHNACHDWLIANPMATKAPDELANKLFAAELAVRDYKRDRAQKTAP